VTRSSAPCWAAPEPCSPKTSAARSVMVRPPSTSLSSCSLLHVPFIMFPPSCSLHHVPSESKEPPEETLPERVDEHPEGECCLSFPSFSLSIPSLYFISLFHFSISFLYSISLSIPSLSLYSISLSLSSLHPSLSGCYFEGDQKMHAPGTTWHPFVPPFGFIKCAVCTCKVQNKYIIIKK